MVRSLVIRMAMRRRSAIEMVNRSEKLTGLRRRMGIGTVKRTERMTVKLKGWRLGLLMEMNLERHSEMRKPMVIGMEMMTERLKGWRMERRLERRMAKR